MPFTSVAAICSATKPFIICLALLLTACGGMQKKTTEKLESPPEQLQADASDKGLPPLQRIPQPENPNKPTIPSSAKSEFRAALNAIQAEKWQQAEELLLLMSETYPQLAGIYTNLGIVYQHTKLFDKAEKSYRFALKTNPYNFDAYTNLGTVYRELGRFNEAEALYKEALARWPHHQASVVNLGVLYDMYLGKLDLALEQFKLAQRLNEKEDRQLKGWIIDLERRLASQGG